jgi:DNA-binding NtrC family response regulator
LRLMVVGNLDGRLAAAARIAMGKGAPVRHADGIETALSMLQSGPGPTRPWADLLMVDAVVDIRGLAAGLAAVGLAVPIVACSTRNDARTAVAAVHAGAREYIPLPPQAEVIAAILTAVADDGHVAPPPPAGDGSQAAEDRAQVARVAHAALAAGAVTQSLVGRTVADVERDLILETLKRCLGNRTRAAGILGISVRTLRNKLAVYAGEGIDVPPPNNGEIRGAA